MTHHLRIPINQNIMNKLCVMSLLGCLLALIQGSEIKEEVSLAVTVYNDQFAIVKDVRSISFDQGRSDLYFTDVSSNIETETVTFKALQNPEGIKVFEQNYEANLINTKAILQKYIDKEIEIYAKVGDESIKVKGTLLGYNSGYIFKTNRGIEVYNNIDGINFPSLPAGFLTLPTLNWKVFSEKALTTNCEVAYRTTGFSWKSDYSLTLNGDETRADVGGWVTIDNNSGKRYKNTKLKLIAGDVNTVENKGGVVYQKMKKQMIAEDEEAAPQFSQKSFSDYHMYTLSEPVTLEQNSQKQIEFIPKVYGVDVRKYHLIEISVGGYTQDNLKASNRIELSNTDKNKMGMPLPKGTVRVFKEDSADNSLEFIGEDSIGHTPKDQNITLTTGNAFDITASKIATNYLRYSPGYSADLNLTIWNHKNIPAQIVVEVDNYNGDNTQFTWKTPVAVFERVSANLMRLTRTFKAGEKFSYIWNEYYRG